MEFILIIFLILLNGFFAMAEIAVVASRKSKLQQLSVKGNSGAKTALELAQNTDKFFPTIQIGITLIGILAGAIGQATLTTPFSEFIKQIPIIGAYHGIISFIVVVGEITYVSLIVGELVPKYIAINNPEGMATLVAPFMKTLSAITFPLVNLLSLSTEVVLRLMRVKKLPTSTINEDEIKSLMSEGERAGIFNLIEKRLVDRVLHLDDLRVDSLMTPREEIQWFDMSKSSKDFEAYLVGHKHSRIILGDKTIDNLVGVIHVKDYIGPYMINPKDDIRKHSHNPHYIRENTSAIKALELFRKSPMHVALIIDEYRRVKGLVTFNDVLEAVVGDIQEKNWINRAKIVKRSDNSLLVDGMFRLEELKNILKIETLPEEASKYLTLGGFMSGYFSGVPVKGSNFELAGYSFEILSMDGARVDKVLVTQI